MQKTTLAKLILASCTFATLTACGSTGGTTLANNGPLHPPPGLTPAQVQQKQDIGNLMYFADDMATSHEMGGQTYKVTDFAITVNGRTYTGQEYPTSSGSTQLVAFYNINDFKQGLSEQNVRTTAKDDHDHTAETSGTMKVYNQPYSFATGQYLNQWRDWGETTAKSITHQVHRFGGIATETLPASTTINYAGKALSQNDTGELQYSIEYTSSNNGFGSGTITGMHTYGGDITLQRSNIGSGYQVINPKTGQDETIPLYHINGQAQFADGSTNKYVVGIYGPGATEIAGKVTTNQTFYNSFDKVNQPAEISFAGSKQ